MVRTQDFALVHALTGVPAPLDLMPAAVVAVVLAAFAVALVTVSFRRRETD